MGLASGVEVALEPVTLDLTRTTLTLPESNPDSPPGSNSALAISQTGCTVLCSRHEHHNCMVQELTNHTGAVWCMKFSRDGTFLGTGGDDTVPMPVRVRARVRVRGRGRVDGRITAGKMARSITTYLTPSIQVVRVWIVAGFTGGSQANLNPTPTPTPDFSPTPTPNLT